ncbi:MAG: hypothetical protein MJZ34_02730 [Paludibacteraceae bacterium]|nr:hypothetical protein [Paludibacteraceae bacterium]
MSEEKKSFIANFSSWVAGTFNGAMDSLASRMNTNLSSMYSPANMPGSYSSSKTSDYTNSMNYDPQMYYDILDNFPYFNALVNIYADALYEVISKDPIQVTCNDNKLQMHVNKVIEEFKLKDFILAHIKDFVKHGTFVGFIESSKEITEVINPYQVKFINKKGRFLAASLGDVQLPFYDLFTYWYDKDVKDMYTEEEMEAQSQKAASNSQEVDYKSLTDDIESDLNIHSVRNTAGESESAMVKKFKKSVEVNTVLYTGKGYFDEHLTDLYRLFVRQYVYDALSLSDYLKCNVITATVNSQKTDVRKVMEVVNNIEALLNEDNINVVMSYSDPLQLLNQINDKLINRIRVVPQITDYSDLQRLDLTSIKEQLDALKEDIEKSKEQLQNDLKIPEDIFTGNGNRWELSSKYEEYTNTLTHMLNTVSAAICRFCTSYMYRLDAKYYPVNVFTHKFDLNKYISPHMQKSNLTALSERFGEINSVLESATSILSNKAIDKSKFLVYVQNELENADPDLQGMIDYDVIAGNDKSKSTEKSESSNTEEDWGSDTGEESSEISTEDAADAFSDW